ncbi:hypothetical protein PR048_033253 [Dryococelus australis]|uniref:Uncharacterized protein n=1 Tax=Dryococelus australis TaxID=614101 RepID=A0ABQ9FZR1_9NEOP|nr:hypothetical protein PR048_033253 [Dryococelus australis]
MKGRGEWESPEKTYQRSGIVWDDYHTRKLGGPAGDWTRFASVGGGRANRSATPSPTWPNTAAGMYPGSCRSIMALEAGDRTEPSARPQMPIPEKLRLPAASSGAIPTRGKSGSDPAGNRTRFAQVAGEQSDCYTTPGMSRACLLRVDPASLDDPPVPFLTRRGRLNCLEFAEQYADVGSKPLAPRRQTHTTTISLRRVPFQRDAHILIPSASKDKEVHSGQRIVAGCCGCVRKVSWECCDGNLTSHGAIAAISHRFDLALRVTLQTEDSSARPQRPARARDRDVRNVLLDYRTIPGARLSGLPDHTFTYLSRTWDAIAEISCEIANHINPLQRPVSWGNAADIGQCSPWAVSFVVEPLEREDTEDGSLTTNWRRATSTYAPVAWPARSPDLTPLDYFLRSPCGIRGGPAVAGYGSGGSWTSSVLQTWERSTCDVAVLRSSRGNEATVAERLACSPPTRANLVQSPAGSLPDFRIWESCRTMPVRRVFSGISRFPRPFIPALHLEYLHSILTSNGFCVRSLKYRPTPSTCQSPSESESPRPYYLRVILIDFFTYAYLKIQIPRII